MQLTTCRHPDVAAAPAPGAAALPNKAGVVVVERTSELAAFVPAWEDLVAGALEPNVFYEPWMLMPAARTFAADQALFFVFVFLPDPRRPDGPPRLGGFFPLQRRRGYRGVPVTYLSLWKHIYCFLCTPLLRAEGAAETLDVFFDWLRRDPRGAALIEMPFVNGDGPFQQLLVRYFRGHATCTDVSECYVRALYYPRSDAERYLEQALTTKRRKELRRQEKRLSELGDLQYRVLQPGGDVSFWLDEFLRLEALGWKGRQQTALASHAADGAFFKEVAQEAFRRGRLMLLGLFLDDKPLALKCNFLAADGGFAFKIAFDEAFARYSPGVHLEMANMAQARALPNFHWMDSCAVADHFMINRLWTERRVIQNVLASSGRAPGDFVVSLLPLLRWMKKRLIRRSTPTKPLDDA